MSHSRRIPRLLTEGAVIVISILLAFWIDAWWDQRQARATETAVLASIREEVEENRIELDRLLDLNETQFQRIDLFLGMTPDELRAVPADSVTSFVAAMVITWTYDGDDSAAGLFLGSSTPVTQHARDVRSVLAQWVRLVEDTEEEKETVWELGSDLARLLAIYTTPVAFDGQGLLHEVAGRLGPTLLAQLRLDDGFVAALQNKAHYQTVYVLELTQASAVLDSLRGLVQEGAGNGEARSN
jgi:hypothetical protein